jgi:hypothetical protein
MSALPHPHAEDLIIRREPAGPFTVGVIGGTLQCGTPQIVCRTFEDALQRAGGFASQQHVRLWYTTDGLRCTPLGDVALLRRIWREYVEMPGLRLTRAQAQRLWTVDVETCTSLLETLVELKFLVHSPDGKYARVVDATEPLARLHMAKADVVGAPLAARTFPRAG